ncbi:hypothetical protein L7F22_036210 [Adiantum nelumboides]|nr:hypothetical protein [Adiantum nelumboides]
MFLLNDYGALKTSQYTERAVLKIKLVIQPQSIEQKKERDTCVQRLECPAQRRPTPCRPQSLAPLAVFLYNYKREKVTKERSKKLELPSSPAASVENKEKIAEGVVAPSFEQGKETESTPASPTSSATGRPTDAVSLSSTSLSAATTLATAGHTLESSEAELVLLPLRIAFETKQPKLVESALDCLHKLISYEHLEGDAGVEGGKNSSMITDMFNMVCAAADNNAPDSTILQVLKVLLMAAASTKFRGRLEEVIEDQDIILFTETRESPERGLLRVHGYVWESHIGSAFATTLLEAQGE